MDGAGHQPCNARHRRTGPTAAAAAAAAAADVLTARLQRELDGTCVQWDMGHGIPFRGATFDGAISVSALQVNTNSQCHPAPHTSHLTPHTPHLTHHTPHTPHLTHHTSHLTPHTSHLTPHLQSHQQQQRSLAALFAAPQPRSTLNSPLFTRG